MKKLGRGWQYAVYDLGNGRVLKKYHSWPVTSWIILIELFPYKTHGPWVIPEWVVDLKQKASNSFEVIERNQVPPDWIGNPKRLNGLDFEQDKVAPLHDVFYESSAEQQKELIDSFVKFCKELHALGVIDQQFNITKNFGLSSEGTLVLTDIGELFDDPQRIEKQLKKRIWASDRVAGYIKNLEVRQYFVSEMDRAFGI